jgi:hypothetical protein
MSRTSTVLVLVCVTLGLAAAPAAAQVPKPEELKASVPALDAMHDVIMPLWHDAWPNKDVKAMAAMLPDIEKHYAAVSKAELPLLLRDKQALWAAGLMDLKATVGEYKAAVGSGDNDALLKAAEKLHAQYEGLVKIVRPVLKEMEDFHATLYVLYHHQMTPFQLAKASESIQALQVKMGALNKASLPDRLKAKADAFNTQRARLSKAVDDLVALLDSKDEPRIKEAIELMHIQYESLEQIFEAPRGHVPPAAEAGGTWHRRQRLPGPPVAVSSILSRPAATTGGPPKPCTAGQPCATLLTHKHLPDVPLTSPPAPVPGVARRCTPRRRALELLDDRACPAQPSTPKLPSWPSRPWRAR